MRQAPTGLQGSDAAESVVRLPEVLTGDGSQQSAANLIVLVAFSSMVTFVSRIKATQIRGFSLSSVGGCRRTAGGQVDRANLEP